MRDNRKMNNVVIDATQCMQGTNEKQADATPSVFKMKAITYAQLEQLEACDTQLELFKERFGEVLELTVETDPAIAAGFDIDWLANKVLTASNRREYKKATAAAWAEL